MKTGDRMNKEQLLYWGFKFTCFFADCEVYQDETRLVFLNIKTQTIDMILVNFWVMKKRPRTNRHHLTPRSRGGQTLPSNILRIKIVRHCAWHQLWQNKTLKEIIKLLLIIRQEDRFRTTPQWIVMWGNKNISQVIALLERVYSIKQTVRKHYSL